MLSQIITNSTLLNIGATALSGLAVALTMFLIKKLDATYKMLIQINVSQHTIMSRLDQYEARLVHIEQTTHIQEGRVDALFKRRS